MTTNMCDLRIKGENMARWYQEFTINEDLKRIYHPNTLILFELLDFSPQLISENSKKLNSDKMYPVAWGFLRPLGSAFTHSSKKKI